MVIQHWTIQIVREETKTVRHSSLIEYRLLVRWVVGTIPLIYLLFQLVLHNWCIKCHCMCYLFTDRIAHTTAFVTPIVEHWLEREIAQWVHPIKDRSDDPSHHERTLLPRSYISFPIVIANITKLYLAPKCSSGVRAFAHGAMGRRIDPSWGGPIELFLVSTSLHDWCNKGHGMCYPVCGMVHIKEPLLLIEKSSPCGGSGFPLSLSEWSFTICLTPYNRK